jgi:hypothetical protein
MSKCSTIVESCEKTIPEAATNTGLPLFFGLMLASACFQTMGYRAVTADTASVSLEDSPNIKKTKRFTQLSGSLESISTLLHEWDIYFAT